MKALVYDGPGAKAWKEVPDPVIAHPTDAIVRIDTTTICGTDLHILKGDVPAVVPGRILGHEGVGTVTEVGSSVSGLKPGDRVIVSCIKSCGHCSNCRKQLFSHCLGDEGQAGTGWIFGHLIDGTQAEFVRVPYADNSLHKLPEGVSDDEAVMLSDILPTAFEIGVLDGRVAPGDIIAVVGAGPIGLAAMATAGLCGAATIIAIDPNDSRLARAVDFGATHTINPTSADWLSQALALTDGAGVDVALEAVGIPETFGMCLQLVRPGGNVANIGVHGKPVELPLQDLWIRNINISMGLVNTNTTPMLLRLVAQRKLPAGKFATHHFPLDQIMDAYDTFSRASETEALKVVLSRGAHE
ncbi:MULTISPECIES: zinc-dependent alcohol dehydrogenase family protein [Paenarthrobacter]|jgi:alcohol dehydrogenase|uniref:zinc-dependent alcohol dehydrogenase family protein n=1 Tax=Paenarthrobacter TaxID=1742992 RepID=UPI0014079D0D|nr:MULTISPECIES: zinc-dependent alcohol dehydrogenase family protein [Paenarthrobacter]MCX8454884.1 zinc-dependent alcohol dehydrogenase family protein [Paenarthrobacter ureafaciens]MCY0973069.1 zinc-dependent alcohol dehydrogenase family protein [Paenarthrobacter ureafaciens]QOT17291.1 zinc-dependent alcohol dehydrogenase family protein [Paenarthrobacter sp. YJN-5]